MKTKKSLILYFSVVVILVVMCYGLKTTFAYFIASEQGTATNIKVAKLNYTITSESLTDNAITLKPYEIKKINITLKSDYDIATIYRLNYIGDVLVEKSSTSLKGTKNIIEPKESVNIDLVITNNTDKEQSVVLSADGGYVGNELADGNITGVYDETLLQNKVLVDGSLTLTDKNDYRDLNGTNNYLKIDETMYRILGVFKDEDKLYLKIITNETIGTHLFGENNNYLTSSLNTYLNVDYKDNLNEILKSTVKEVTYYTAGLNGIITKEQKEQLSYYNAERGTLLADESYNNSGKSIIGLMYLSDYENASWLNKPYNEATIVPNVTSIDSIFCLTYKEEKTVENDVETIKPINAISDVCKVNEELNVRPVMYLDNKLIIESGTGIETDPYIVKLDTNN